MLLPPLLSLPALMLRVVVLMVLLVLLMVLVVLQVVLLLALGPWLRLGVGLGLKTALRWRRTSSQRSGGIRSRRVGFAASCGGGESARLAARGARAACFGAAPLALALAL